MRGGREAGRDVGRRLLIATDMGGCGWGAGYQQRSKLVASRCADTASSKSVGALAGQLAAGWCAALAGKESKSDLNPGSQGRMPAGLTHLDQQMGEAAHGVVGR